MRRFEYMLSIVLAVTLLAVLVVWTQASDLAGETAQSCRPGKVKTAVVLKGMSIFPACPTAKRG
jgi:hypothetical protein